MGESVTAAVRSNDYLETGAEIVRDRTEDSPLVLRLAVTNRLCRKLSIHTGLPFPIGGTRTVDAPVPLHLVPTSTHVEERNLNGPSQPYHLGEVGGEACWVAEEGYGGVDTLAAEGISAEETRTFDFALAVDPDAVACLPAGDYVFEAELGVSHPPIYEVREWLAWRITVEIA